MAKKLDVGIKYNQPSILERLKNYILTIPERSDYADENTDEDGNPTNYQYIRELYLKRLQDEETDRLRAIDAKEQGDIYIPNRYRGE